MMYVDQLGREIKLLKTPKRIVSLVPSQTELLVDLGLMDSIVGVTKFCVHPDTIRSEKTVVGGTKKVNYQKIKQLRPDIILCNKEENTREIVEVLQETCAVHVSDIFSIDDALTMIRQYGEIFKKEYIANQLVSKIKLEKKAFTNFIHNIPKRKVAYFIWKDPWIAVGNTTFIHHILEMNNFVNVFADQERYPEISEDQIRSLELDMILLSSEPYPFTEKHISVIKNINPNPKVVLVDGEYFSWYGSRLTNAFLYFKTLH